MELREFESLLWWQSCLKRCFDLVFSLVGLFLTFPIIILCYVFASFETRASGFFIQTRIGRYGEPFQVIKIRTMYPSTIPGKTITVSSDNRITKSGRFFRRTKLDELPQLWNILIGDMSFVGPRPDVPGYADCLTGPDRLLLLVRPGITGPASLKYRDEEILLASQIDPEAYNNNIIWPDKVAINVLYVKNWRFFSDIKYILKTVFT
jgi:lipopolysaccharide/colanic/teichoic acid biosynthesis glycosyltransferase